MGLEKIFLPRSILAEIYAHIEMDVPHEACGLLGGKNGRVSIHIPVTNMLHSPSQFRMNPEEQLQALIKLESLGADLLVIYHSHPKGPAHPSPTDLNSHFYPEAACIILARIKPEWDIQAFLIRKGISSKIPIFIGD